MTAKTAVVAYFSILRLDGQGFELVASQMKGEP